jgi:hypothetical protein
MEYTYTDTFGGEANFCWVYRGDVSAAKDLKQALRLARKELGLTGMKGDIVADYGDELHWKPRNCCTILMVSWTY